MFGLCLKIKTDNYLNNGDHLWLGQFFPLLGWAKVWLLAQFWLGQVAGPILLDRYYGWAILAGLMAGSSIGPAKFFFTLAGPKMAAAGPAKWAFPQH